MRTWRHNQRDWMVQSVVTRQGETAHMRLARMFGISCQQVLDIIDPERERQRKRVERYAAQKAHHDEYLRLATKYQPVMDELRDEKDPVRRFELLNRMSEFCDFLGVPIRPLVEVM